MRRIQYCLIALLGLTAAGCVFQELDKIQDLEEIRYNPSFALPLVDASISFQDVIDQVYQDSSTISLVSGPENEITIRYTDSLVSQGANDLFGGLSESIDPITANIAVPANTYSTNDSISSFPLEFAVESATGERLDSALLAGGSLDVSINSTFTANADLVFTLPSLRASDNITSSLPLIIPLNSNTSTSISEPLEDYILDLVRIDGQDTSYNTIFIQAFVVFNESTPINQEENVEVTLSIGDVGFKEIYGLFGQQTIETGAGSLPLAFFDNVPEDGEFFLSDPSIRLDFANSFGLDIGLNFNSFAGIQSNGDTIALEGQVVDNQTIIRGPELNEIGETNRTSLIIDNQTSNFAELLSAFPSEIIYDIGGTTNPSGVDRYNFVLENSTLSANLTAELTLAGRFRLEYETESGLDSLGLDSIELQRVNLVITSSNYFPVDVGLTLNFLNADSTILFSATPEGGLLMTSGAVDANGFIEESSVTPYTAEITLEGQQLELLPDATILQTQILLETTDRNQQTNVVFRTTDRIDLQVGIETEFEVNQPVNQ